MKPILFNTEMVRAILDDRKTITRRVMKPQPELVGRFWAFEDTRWSDTVRTVTPLPGHALNNRAPYSHGDILWVRETWRPAVLDIDTYFLGSCVSNESCNGFNYKADMGWLFPERPDKDNTEFRLVSPTALEKKWHPSIHMPRKAARIFLRVTDVRVERLQDITLFGMDAEGRPICDRGIMMACSPGDCIRCDKSLENSIPWFQRTWDSTIKPADLPVYGWDANPWVWVISFERISKEEATG